MSLKIYIHTANGRQAIDLLPNTHISIEAVNPLFAEDLSQDLYSLPIELPFTDNNKRLLGAPEMLESTIADKEQFYTIDLLYRNMPRLTGIKLSLLRINCDWNYTEGRYIASISGAMSLFGSLVKYKMLHKLGLFPIMYFTHPSSRDYATAVMKNPTHRYRGILSFAPVHRPQYFDTQHSEYDNESMTGDIANFIVYNPSSSDWVFGAPSLSNPAIAAPPGQANDAYAKHRTIPFFKLTAVVRAIFEHFNYQVQGNFFDLPGVQAIHIDNNQALEVYSGKNIDLNRQIDCNYHLPQMSVAQFLNTIVKAFNLRLSFSNVSRTAYLQVKSTPSRTQVIDLTSYVSGGFETEEQEDMTQRINWTFDTNDEMVASFIKEDLHVKKRATFNTLAQAMAATYTPALAQDDTVYIIAENAYYSYRQTVNKWVYIAEAHETSPTNSDNTDALEIEAAPLLNYVLVDENANNIRMNMVSATGAGSYTSFKFAKIQQDFGLRLLMIETVNNPAYQSPVPTSSNRNAQLSLSYSEPNIGMYATFWKAWNDKLRYAKVVKAKCVGVNYDIDELCNSIIKIKNYLFAVQSITEDMGEAHVMELKLIKFE